MITVQTRQNSKGNWWCNTTYQGEDISAEHEFTYMAQSLMSQELQKRGYIGQVNFESPKPYPKKTKVPKPPINYEKMRIDHNPQG